MELGSGGDDRETFGKIAAMHHTSHSNDPALGGLDGRRWDAIRRRVIRETEAAIEQGLDHPESVVWIPTLIVGAGKFDAKFSRSFWANVLGLSSGQIS